MAVYDGFFDAVLDEETGEADRAYGSGDFTGYFEKIIGSGVCVQNDQDSFKVRFAGGEAVVSPGYLFIQGYWLRNDADYTIPLTGDATLAIAAHLNLGRRMIELEAVSVAQSYPDTLVLALVNPASGTAEDTRYNTDICGVIDTAGELSKKVTWAINYIDNEIENKLAVAEADIAKQSKLLDAKIAEVQAQVDKIAPPPVGTIQFSTSQNVGEEWLRCDGSFVSEQEYPELVAALGKLTPSGDKFQLISDGEVGPQISNGVLYGGRLWVYSYSTRKLYGIDTEGEEAVKEVELTSENKHFSDFAPPSVAHPIVLSVVPHKIGTGAKIFLAQILSEGSLNYKDYEWIQQFLLFGAEFTGEENEVKLQPPFSGITIPSGIVVGTVNYELCAPYVSSAISESVEKYSCVLLGYNSIGYIEWSNENDATQKVAASSSGDLFDHQRTAFSKNQGEVVSLKATQPSNGQWLYTVTSSPLKTYSYSSRTSIRTTMTVRRTPGPLNVVGASKVLSSFDLHNLPWCSYVKDDIKTVDPQISLPSAARVFVDGAAYLWGKDIFLIFVGTGIIFSRTLEEGDFGYLDTTSVLGTITQFGYLDYSQDEGTLYIMGQDTTNKVKAAKIVLNTLYDYANDGAWLPMLASDGVPAYIKAREGT